MLPMALLVAIWLSASRAWRGAVAWVVLFAIGSALVVCTKVAYLGWGVGFRPLDFTGISGHAMTATATLSVAGYFAGDRYSRFAAIAAGSFGCLLGVAIAISRVIIGVHSPSEVVVGCALGCAIALASIRVIHTYRRVVASPVVFVIALVALVVTLHGERAPSEHLITRLALYLSGHSAPFARYIN